ncbi:GerAB/ArcD/ProY family transporter [Paenibacillus sepulcri]|uniref:Spore germination protein n=1 Tax=Paenibacillus sepulcri TaxID=359917 RepID=A0ABS7C1M6_9BACL|nr:spore germination protein [Paenibacillus sepulcri]
MISQKQLVSLLVLIICFNNFGVFKMMTMIHGQRDAWIGVLLSSIPALIWAFVLAWISHRMSSVTVQGWLKQRAGTFIGVLITAVLAVILMLNLYVNMTDLIHWVNIWFLPNTPNFIVVFIISVSVLLGSLLGLRTLAIAAGILLPIVVVLFVILLFGIFKFLHFYELVPLLERGWIPVRGSLLSSLAGMSDWFILIVLAPFVDTKSKINFKTIYALLLVHVITLVVPIVISLGAFGTIESIQQRTPVFEQWRLAKLGMNFSHIDSLSIIYFFSVSLIRQSLLLFAVCSLMPRKTMSPSVGVMIVIWLAISCVCLMSTNDLKFIQLSVRWHDLALGLGLGAAAMAFFILSFRRLKVKPGAG